MGTHDTGSNETSARFNKRNGVCSESASFAQGKDYFACVLGMPAFLRIECASSLAFRCPSSPRQIVDLLDSMSEFRAEVPDLIQVIRSFS